MDRYSPVLKFLLALFVYLSIPHTAGAIDVGVGVFTDRNEGYFTDETPTLYVSGFNHELTSQPFDVHVGLIAPDGTIYEFPDWNTQLRPWLPALSVPANFQLPPTPLGNVTGLPNGFAPGIYYAAAALTKPGTLDVVALYKTPFDVASYETPLLIGGVVMVKYPIVPSGFSLSAGGSFNFSGSEGLQAIRSMAEFAPTIDQCLFIPDANVLVLPEAFYTPANAGEFLTIRSETGESISLDRLCATPNCDGGYIGYGAPFDTPHTFFRPDLAYTLTTPGGPDVGPRTQTVTAPDIVSVTQPSSSATRLNPDENLQLSWLGNGGVGEIEVTVIGGIYPTPALISCRFADDGAAAISSSLLGQLRDATTPGGSVGLQFNRTNREFFAQGRLDSTFFSLTNSTQFSLNLE